MFQLNIIELKGLTLVMFHPKLTYLVLTVLAFAGLDEKGVIVTLAALDRAIKRIVTIPKMTARLIIHWLDCLGLGR